MARAEREPDAALARAQEAMKLAPDLVPAVALAARLLSRRGDYRKASKTSRPPGSHRPHPELADAYVHVRPRRFRARPHDPGGAAADPAAPRAEGRLAVAEAALASRDFGRARAVLAPLLEGRPARLACAC